MNRFRTDARGFTLMELLVIIAVISVAAAVAAPSVSAWMKSAQLDGAAREVYSLFQKARMEAVKRRTKVAICFKEGTGRDGYCEIFVDDSAGEANAFIRQPGETLLASMTMPPGVSLTDPDFGNPSKASGFNSQGRSRSNGHVILQNDGAKTYTVNLSNAGNIRLETGLKPEE